jgi:hypothetical protein
MVKEAVKGTHSKDYLNLEHSYTKKQHMDESLEECYQSYIKELSEMRKVQENHLDKCE